MFSSNSFKLSIVSFSLLAVSVAGSYFVWQKVEQRGQELVTNLQSIRDREKIDDAYNTLRNDVDATAALRDELFSYVLSGEADTVEFLSTLDQVANEIGVELSTKNLEVVKGKDENFSDLVINIYVKGSESGVFATLKALEHLPYQSSVNGLTLSRHATGEGSGSTEMNLKLVVTIKNSL